MRFFALCLVANWAIRNRGIARWRIYKDRRLAYSCQRTSAKFADNNL